MFLTTRDFRFLAFLKTAFTNCMSTLPSLIFCTLGKISFSQLYPCFLQLNNVSKVCEKVGLPLEDCYRIVDIGKVKWAINSFKPYKSAGSDGDFPAMLQESFDCINQRLVRIFISSLKLGFIPKEWTKVKVVFIPKTGRSSHSSAKDYRPITLSSFMRKTLETLVDMDIRAKIDQSLSLFRIHNTRIGKVNRQRQRYTCLEEISGNYD
jgi:hypothetical protein